MISMALKRMMRKPVSLLATLCFSAILSAALCGFYTMNLAEEKNCEEAFRTVPVTVTVTDLTGQYPTELYAKQWVYNAFTSSYEMGEYLTDIRVKVKENIQEMWMDGERCYCSELIGITSLESAPELTPNMAGAVKWRDGYDASAFASNDLVCIVPASILPEGDDAAHILKLYFKHKFITSWGSDTTTYDCTLRVIGSHNLDNNAIYCPFRVVSTVNDRLETGWDIDSVSATLADNYLLDEFREAASEWFAEPNPTGAQTPWKYSYYTSYPYALVVDDAQLTAATEALEKSMQINQVCTAIIFALAVAASFLVGFLTVRNRKREIMLMRTLGTGNGQVYLEFVLEQMGCILLGILLGGIWFLWRPVWRLAAFAGIYFVGLTLSLLIFMGTSLISTMKEDE